MLKSVIKTVLFDNGKQFIYEITAIRNKNKLKYIENGINIILKIDNNRLQMRRSNNEYQLDIDFILNEKTINRYELKEYNKLIDIEVLTEHLLISENYIKVEYKINEESKKYEIFM